MASLLHYWRSYRRQRQLVRLGKRLLDGQAAQTVQLQRIADTLAQLLPPTPEDTPVGPVEPAGVLESVDVENPDGKLAAQYEAVERDFYRRTGRMPSDDELLEAYAAQKHLF